jgi:antitoxin ParD1/3/4
MNIVLKPEYEQFIQAQLALGRYVTIDELIGEALALFIEREQKIVELRHKIAVGTEQIRNGQVKDGETIFAQLQQKLDRQTQGES